MVTGYFYGSITFDRTILTGKGGNDIFVVKYDSSGNVLWAKSAGGDAYETGTGISTDLSGNVFITGYFNSPSLSFDTTNLKNKSAGNGEDIFIVKYDASGNVVWAKSVGGMDRDYGRSISTDLSGNVLVTGEFESASVIFDTTTLNNALTKTKEIFVVKYDASGKVLWAKSAGGVSNEGGTGICTDSSGNVLVTGYFYNASINFGKTILTKTLDYGSDIFVVKYDKYGNVIWAKSAQARGNESGTGICTDLGGNVIITGQFSNYQITFDTTTLTNVGAIDIFVVKFDASGNMLWAKSAGGIANDEVYGICSDSWGNVIITGISWSDSINFGTTFLTNQGSVGIFIVKLGPLLTANIEEDFAVGKGLVYPNPFNFFTTIRLGSSINNGQLNIYNVHGQLVKEIKNISGRTINLSRENMPSGVYFISLMEDHKKILSNKLVIID